MYYTTKTYDWKHYMLVLLPCVYIYIYIHIYIYIYIYIYMYGLRPVGRGLDEGLRGGVPRRLQPAEGALNNTI